MRYIELEEESRKKLEYEYSHHAKHYFRQRCHALLLSDKGVKVPDISSLLGVRTRTIYEWMNRWESQGLEGLLISSGRGRKPLLSISASELVEEVKKKRDNMLVV